MGERKRGCGSDGMCHMQPRAGMELGKIVGYQGQWAVSGTQDREAPARWDGMRQDETRRHWTKQADR